MKSSIYISSEQIEVVGYTGKGSNITIVDSITAPLPEGTIINGKIIDSGQLLDAIKYMMTMNATLFKDPSLVVDGSLIVAKRLTVPKLSKNQYLKLIQDDFADTSENFEDLVCGYEMAKGNDPSQTAILACGTARENIEVYLAVFKDAGIKLSAIRVGVSAVIGYVASTPSLQDRSVVINLIDGVTMLSMIFENGVNVFISRTRLYSENEQEFTERLIENLNGLIQFNRSQNFQDITHSYYLGLSHEQLADLALAYTDTNIEVQSLRLGAVSGNQSISYKTYFSILGAMLSDNSIDFISSISQLEKFAKNQRPKNYWIPILAGLVVVLSIPAVMLYAKTQGFNKEITKIVNYIRGDEVVAKSKELDTIISKTSEYLSLEAMINEKRKTDKSKATIDNKILDLITTTHKERTTATMLDFDETTGVIRVNGQSATEKDSSAYVEELKKSKLISNITYTGYSYSSDGRFNFSIDVKLAIKGVK